MTPSGNIGSAAATLAVNQIINQANTTVKNHTNLKSKGGSFGGVAFTADEYIAALGANEAVLDAIVTANPQT